MNSPDLASRLEALWARVESPSRYAGLEWGAARPRGRAQVCLALPRVYEEGVLSPALNALYAACWRRGLEVERAFLPAPDLEAALGEGSLPWFSWETKRPLSSFEALVLVLEDPKDLGSAGRFPASRLLVWDPKKGGAAPDLAGGPEEVGRRLAARFGVEGVVDPPVQIPGWCVPYSGGSRERVFLGTFSGDLAGLEEACRKALRAAGLERLEAATEAPVLPPYPEGLEDLLVRRAARLDLVLGPGGKPYASLPGPGARALRREGLPRPRARYRLRLARGSEVRWVTHREQVRAFRRALRRSGLPVGLDPSRRPGFVAAFGPPIAAGMESLAEYLDLALVEARTAVEVGESLGRVLPEGLRVLEARRIPLDFPSVEALATLACFDVISAGSMGADLEERASGPLPPGVRSVRPIPGGAQVLLPAREAGTLASLLSGWFGGGVAPWGVRWVRTALAFEGPEGLAAP